MMTYIVAALLVGILVWRVVVPTMKLKAREPGTGVDRALLVPKEKSGDGEGWFTKYGRHSLSVLVAIVGVGLAIWGFVTQARPADVGSWSWQYWFPLLVIWGTLAALIALNKEVLGAASKTLQMVLAVGMTVALVILPVWSWWVTPVPIPRQAKQEIPLASSPQSTWPKRAIPEGKSEFISRPPGMKPRIAGYNFTPYVVYADGSECPGRERQCPEGSVGVRVRNNAPGENIIAYAFVPD